MEGSTVKLQGSRSFGYVTRCRRMLCLQARRNGGQSLSLYQKNMVMRSPEGWSLSSCPLQSTVGTGGAASLPGSTSGGLGRPQWEGQNGLVHVIYRGTGAGFSPGSPLLGWGVGLSENLSGAEMLVG